MRILLRFGINIICSMEATRDSSRHCKVTELVTIQLWWQRQAPTTVNFDINSLNLWPKTTNPKEYLNSQRKREEIKFKKFLLLHQPPPSSISQTLNVSSWQFHKQNFQCEDGYHAVRWTFIFVTDSKEFTLTFSTKTLAQVSLDAVKRQMCYDDKTFRLICFKFSKQQTMLRTQEKKKCFVLWLIFHLVRRRFFSSRSILSTSSPFSSRYQQLPLYGRAPLKELLLQQICWFAEDRYYVLRRMSET